MEAYRIFVTDQNIHYVYYFRREFDKLLYEFGFYKLNESQGSVEDLRVKETIKKAIIDFFENTNQDIVLYTAQSNDQRHKSRYLLFDKWYKEDLKDTPIKRKSFEWTSVDMSHFFYYESNPKGNYSLLKK